MFKFKKEKDSSEAISLGDKINEKALPLLDQALNAKLQSTQLSEKVEIHLSMEHGRIGIDIVFLGELADRSRRSFGSVDEAQEKAELDKLVQETVTETLQNELPSILASISEEENG